MTKGQVACSHRYQNENKEQRPFNKDRAWNSGMRLLNKSREFDFGENLLENHCRCCSSSWISFSV